MKKLMIIWTSVLIFISCALFLPVAEMNAKEILSLTIKDSYPGDTPDGFPSPGEKIALNITATFDFIPEEAYIVCDMEHIKIENPRTKFYLKIAGTLINTSFEPTILIEEDCPTDMQIPCMLIYKKDTIFDTLLFSIHTVAKFDSFYLDKKVNKTNSKIHLKVDVEATEGYLSGFSGILARIKDTDGRIIEGISLFDDGKHYDGEAGDGRFANSWWTPASSNDYVVDLTLIDSTTNHSFIINQVAGFTTEDFTLTKPYLIVNDPYSNSPGNEEVETYKELMDSLKLDYDTWNVWFRGYPHYNECLFWGSQKVIIIWATRLGGTLKHSTVGKELIQSFLKRGGNLFLATPYLGNYIKDYGSEFDLYFYEDILCSEFQMRFTADDSLQTLGLRSPFTNQIIDTFNLTLSLPDSNRFVSFTDIIKPVRPAFPIANLLVREDSTYKIDTNHCFGLKLRREKHKIIYLSFNISEILPFNVRKDFFSESLRWISEETADSIIHQPIVKEDTDLVRLSNPYPNPFLSESTIPFVLHSPGYVNLIICDLTGRTVRYLIRSSLNVGHYYAVWDGKNEEGDNTAVGYYFIRLEMKTIDNVRGEEIEIVVSKKILKLRK